MNRQQIFVVLGMICVGVLLAIIVMNSTQSLSSNTGSTATSNGETTDSPYTSSAMSATARFHFNQTAWSIALTENPPFPAPETPATAQILEMATMVVINNSQFAAIATEYAQTPNGMRTPATLLVRFAPTIDTTLLFSSPTPTQ